MPAPSAKRILTVAATRGDAARVLQAVLEGGRPRPKDLDKFRCRKDGSISGDGLWLPRLNSEPDGSPGYDCLPEVCREAIAARGARLAVAFWMLTGAPPGTVCSARWHEIERQRAAFHTWRRPDGVAAPLSVPARQVLERAYAIAMGDDGTRLYLDRLRQYSRTNASEKEWRDWLNLPRPRLRRGKAQGLVFRDGGRASRRAVKADKLHALLRSGAREALHVRQTPRSLFNALPACLEDRAAVLADAVTAAL